MYNQEKYIIKVESLYTEDKPYRFRLLEEINVTLSNGDRISIPKGFITDFRSAPKNIFLRALVEMVVNRVGNHNLAVIIHDYLYDTQYISREFADLEMTYWLRKNKVSLIKINIMHLAVKIGGKRHWNIT